MFGGLLKRILSGSSTDNSGPADGNVAGNDAIRTQLANMGDDGIAPRHVLHFIYPYTDRESSSEPEVKQYLSDFEFYIVRDAAQDGGIVMEQTREVASAAFDAFTAQLNDELHAKGWDYDGWECAVVTKE